MVSGRGFIKAVESGPLDKKTITVIFEDGPPVVVTIFIYFDFEF